jgi:hypothetical protein
MRINRTISWAAAVLADDFDNSSGNSLSRLNGRIRAIQAAVWSNPQKTSTHGVKVRL